MRKTAVMVNVTLYIGIVSFCLSMIAILNSVKLERVVEQFEIVGHLIVLECFRQLRHGDENYLNARKD